MKVRQVEEEMDAKVCSLYNNVIVVKHCSTLPGNKI